MFSRTIGDINTECNVKIVYHSVNVHQCDHSDAVRGALTVVSGLILIEKQQSPCIEQSNFESTDIPR